MGSLKGQEGYLMSENEILYFYACKNFKNSSKIQFQTKFPQTINRKFFTGQTNMSAFSTIPLAVLSDSYKATHFMMYPESEKMVAYSEFRAPYAGQKEDHRFVFFGIRFGLLSSLSNLVDT
jgi:hypothetical protein